MIQVLAARFLVGIMADKDTNSPVTLVIFGVLAFVDRNDFATIAAFMLLYFVGKPAC